MFNITALSMNPEELLSSRNIKHQQKDMLESLKYASYIQRALLPPQEEFRKYFRDYFIMHQPRDIVSGDFYYINRKKNDLIIAVADCTGHGVPGAFMSILGMTFLNEIINRSDFFNAASVLNQLRERIMKALCQRGDDHEQKDGLDMALCIIRIDRQRLHFAGAFNPLYILHEGQLDILEGDKMPVGIAPDEEKSFTDHVYELHERDELFLFSDGYADQFGGPHGKKFKYGQFRELVIKIGTLSAHEQKSILEATFNAWKGNLKQLDDVLVVGLHYQAGN